MNNLCLATNYLLMTESSRQMWIELDRHLDEFGSRLVLMTSAMPQEPLPFPVIEIPFLIRDYAKMFPGAAIGGGHVSAEDLALLETDSIRANRGYPPGEALTGLFACRQLLRTVLETLQPGYVLTWDATSPMAQLLQGLAREQGLPVQGIERGLLPETLMIESRNLQGYSDLRTHWLAQEMPENVFDAKAYERIRSYYLAHKPQKYDQPGFGGGGGALRQSLGLEGKKVVVFLGHYDACGLAPRNGNQRRYNSPVFDSTEAALTAVGDILARDRGVAVIFKPHPLDAASNAVAQVQGVRIVRDVNVHALIDLADVVATQFTTLQYETVFYEKPIVLLGHSAWWGRQAAYEVDRREDVLPALEAALERRDWNLHQARAHAFVTWLMDQFLIGCSEKVPARRRLRDFAAFIGRTSLDSRHLAAPEERWERAAEALESLKCRGSRIFPAAVSTQFRNDSRDVPQAVSIPSPCPKPATAKIRNGQGMSVMQMAEKEKAADLMKTVLEEGMQSPKEDKPRCETPANAIAGRPVTPEPELRNADSWTELHEQARAKTASGDLMGALRLHRQILAITRGLTEKEIKELAEELASLLPQWLQKAAPEEMAGFGRALRLHPELAQRFAVALEKHAARQAAALSMALGSAYLAANNAQAASSILSSVANPEIVSPQFKEGFCELRTVAAVRVEAGLANGWAVRQPTPYPLAVDGRPKLNPVWFEVTSFCNQKCSFCPDPWRESKRQAVDLEVFKKCIDELKNDFHVEYLQLNAYGEPLLHPKFEQMLAYLRDGHAPCPYYFTTNGTMLNERNIAMLDRLHPHGICISLQNDNEESYALSRNLHVSNYSRLAGQTRNLIERFVRNRRACHVRIYQLVRNGKEGWGVPDQVLQAFPGDWERFSAAVHRWEDALSPLADGRNVRVVHNTEDKIREAFEQADHPAWWVKLDLLYWKDEHGGEQSAFICPRPVGTYANQLPHHHPDWRVKQQLLNPGSCCFTRNPGLVIFSNGNLGICCLSLDQNAAFGKLQNFGSLKNALSSEACFCLFAELSNGVARSKDCRICLGQIERVCKTAACPGPVSNSLRA